MPCLRRRPISVLLQQISTIEEQTRPNPIWECNQLALYRVNRSQFWKNGGNLGGFQVRLQIEQLVSKKRRPDDIDPKNVWCAACVHKKTFPQCDLLCCGLWSRENIDSNAGFLRELPQF